MALHPHIAEDGNAPVAAMQEPLSGFNSSRGDINHKEQKPEMKIQTVRIRNFRTLKDVTIPFDSVTTFIGPNGAGKSTVLRALDWFFNGKPGSLTEEDCSFGATDEDIEVQITFADLTEKDREALGKYAPEGVGTFTAWKRRSPDGADVLSANAKGFPDFNGIKAAGGATAKRELYASLRRDRPELDLPAANTGPAVEQSMTTWEAAHTDQLLDAPEALQTNFFGFNSGGKMSGLFDFVLVTADLRASEESIDGKASIIGRILERSIDRTAADEAIAEIVAESRAKQQQVYEEKFKEQLGAITTQLNEVVTTYALAVQSRFRRLKWNSRRLARRSTWLCLMAPPRLRWSGKDTVFSARC